MIRRICVFCSANEGLPNEILREAEAFCDGLKNFGGELLYGGGRSGLMGHFADQALRRGVLVRGAITKGLDQGHEVGHRGLTELVVLPDLFERKKWFLREADAFVVFPGGFG
ncbi:MAG: LOG family protein, partial [Bdellovibrionales bacterium]|nr:LOG family protein [Bdellovibrionales bacterium]